jgi:hypothetical protein
MAWTDFLYGLAVEIQFFLGQVKKVFEYLVFASIRILCSWMFWENIQILKKNYSNTQIQGYLNLKKKTMQKQCTSRVEFPKIRIFFFEFFVPGKWKTRNKKCWMKCKILIENWKRNNEYRITIKNYCYN